LFFLIMPIAWTQEDLDQLKDAILKKASGKRLTSVDLGGRMESYADAPLDQLRALAEEIGASLTTATRPRVFRARYEKGL